MFFARRSVPTRFRVARLAGSRSLRARASAGESLRLEGRVEAPSQPRPVQAVLGCLFPRSCVHAERDATVARGLPVEPWLGNGLALQLWRQRLTCFK